MCIRDSVKIMDELRQGVYDVLVGVNLLRMLIRKNNPPFPESKNCRTKCAAVPSGFTGSVFSYLAKARNFLFLFN